MSPSQPQRHRTPHRASRGQRPPPRGLWVIVTLLMMVLFAPTALAAEADEAGDLSGLCDTGQLLSQASVSAVVARELMECPWFSEDDFPAGMCGEAGTTSVAPAPVVPASRDRAEAAPRCLLELAGFVTATTPREPRDSQATPSLDPAEQATLPTLTFPAQCAQISELPPIPPRELSEDGVRRAPERPPT